MNRDARTTTMTNSKQTAATAYSQKNVITQDLLNRIAGRLAEHQVQQAAKPRDWGFVGDLGHINEELAQVLAAFGDRSGVDELGIKY